ncbi:hypothetical protein K439DRAFT_1623257, partial [Ramaria rubella]
SSEEAPSTPPRVPRPSVVETITTSPSSLSFSFSFSSDRPSEDVLTFSGNGDDLFIRQRLPDADIYRKLEIGEQTFSLAQLVVLVRVVHDHHRGYRLLEYQCYWFARVIYDAIQARGRECIESVYNGPRQLGKFDRIGVKLGKRDTLAIVLQKYDTAWAIVKNEIQQKRWRQQKAAEDAEKAKRIDQEILARQQADKRADMEARARQEEARARQEEARARQEEARARQEVEARLSKAEALQDAERCARQEAEAERDALKALLRSQHP